VSILRKHRSYDTGPRYGSRRPSQQGLHDRAGESRHVEERFHQREDELKRGRGLDLERRALAELSVFEQAARDGAVAVRADFDHEPRDYRQLVGRGEVRGVLGAGSELLPPVTSPDCAARRGECNAVFASLVSGAHHLTGYEKYRQRCDLPGCRLDERRRVGISTPWSFRISVRTSGSRWSLC
jgi:hypothetical protein